MTPAWLSRIWWRRYRHRNATSWEELPEFQQQDPFAQRHLIASRLLRQIQYFGSRADALPEWREAAGITNPDDLWRVWPFLPIVTKETLKAHFPPNEIQARFQTAGIVSSSGGSTGEPTHFFHDMAMARSCQASTIYAQERFGWTQGMPLVKIWGSERDIGKATKLRDRVTLRLLNTTIVDGYSMTDKTVDSVMRLLVASRGAALAGFTTMLEFVARRIIERGDRVPPGIVVTAWNGGEMLFEHQVELFERAFGVPILNLYGGRELSVMAYQPAPGRALEIMRPWLFAEVVDEQGHPVTAGQTGRLLWTSTICQGTPFLRYEIGDLATFDSTHQTEAGVTQLRELQGRTSGLLTLPNGKVIQTLYWNHFFKDVSEVSQFQIVVRKAGGLKLLLVGRTFTPEREQALRSTLTNFLGEIPVEIAWVDRIPLTSQGKLLQVVREP